VKLHELAPAPGSTKRRIRVGRGIAAGKGKTAGRGTKGQKARAGASIPGWFEGGQTPVHVRVPKLRGFKRRGRIEYQVVNVGRIAEYAVAGRFGEEPGKDPLTVNAEVLAAAGLVSHADRPVKVLGHGELDVKVFVAADAFTASARQKIEAAGGFVQALGPARAAQPDAETVEPDDTEPTSEPAQPAPKARAARAKRATAGPTPAEVEAAAAEAAEPEPGAASAESPAVDVVTDADPDDTDATTE
jgi:large subunit ribosomal protein L15